MSTGCLRRFCFQDRKQVYNLAQIGLNYGRNRRPALAEMQPRSVGVVDRVKHKLREMFTPIGRAEVMAQKQMDQILAQVSEEKRAEAMAILESKRPDFVADKISKAKWSLVRDGAIIGSATAGGALGLYRYRSELGTLLNKSFDMIAGKPKTLTEQVVRAAKYARDWQQPSKEVLKGGVSEMLQNVVNAAKKAKEEIPLSGRKPDKTLSPLLENALRVAKQAKEGAQGIKPTSKVVVEATEASKGLAGQIVDQAKRARMA